MAALKILHTSDWHLGQNFYGYNRKKEHVAFFDQLCDIVMREVPDAMVVCGDIFHNYTPSVEAQRLYTESLVKLHMAAPEMEIIITAGNHDSASRLEVDKDLWQLANVHVVGKLRRDKEGNVDFSQHLISVNGKGFVVALPYIASQSYPADPEGKVTDNRKYFFQQLDEFIDSHNPNGLPTVLMAHMSVLGAELYNQRINDGIGGIDYIESDDFGSAFDYVALGHIHHPQTLRGTHNQIRYSGSPIPVSFDEADYDHSVSIVELEHGREPVVNYKDYKINNPIPLLTIPKEKKRTPLALDALRKETPTEGECYIRLNPEERHSFEVTMEEDAVKILEKINPDAHYTTFIPNLTKGNANRILDNGITPDELMKMEPEEIAKQYFDLLDVDFDEYKDLFNEAITRINKEEAQ